MRCASNSFLSLHWWFSFRKRSRNIVTQRPRSVVPRLEQLEDRITPTGPTITTLASFTGSNVVQPSGGLVMDSNGNLYGAGSGAAISGENYVYELAKGSGTITPLASIPASSRSAQRPRRGRTIANPRRFRRCVGAVRSPA